MGELIAAALRTCCSELHLTETANEAFGVLAAHEITVIITDVELPGLSGIEFCKRVVANRPDIPVIIVTAFPSFETALDALRVGATDFVVKPFKPAELLLRIEHAMRAKSLQHEVKRLREQLGVAQSIEGMLGQSAPMMRLKALLARVAGSRASVFITGESGTGKEVAAHALHKAGPRALGPFIAINSSAIPGNLLESELFGHTKGAFTDAHSDRIGLFVRATGGTLFLDEIGEMPIHLQPKLLRALEERVVRPIGSARDVPFDVRVIAATNKDIEAAVADGRFREDLYFRLNVIGLELPPLCERGQDILLLAHHFLRKFAHIEGKEILGFSPAAAEKLLDYPWPGNVRELRNCVERAVALAEHQDLLLEDLPTKIRTHEAQHVLVSSHVPSELITLEVLEKRYISRVMAIVGGNKTHAAQTLGIDRKRLYRKLRRYNVS